jgi:RNA polymerase-binding transcription factor DksA
MPSEALLADLRSRLEEERDQLRNQLVELGFADGGTGLEYDDNFADSSQVTAERGEAEALARTLGDTLAEVERALAKIEDGTFGICETCGNPITEARLEAMPAAKSCMDCASKR